MLKNKKTIILLVALFCLINLISLKNEVYGNTVNFYGTTSAALQTAINNASNGDTIVLQSDITINSEVKLPTSKSITITDNGTNKTIGRASNYKGYMFVVPKLAELTLIGSFPESLIITGNNISDSSIMIYLIGGNLNMYDGVVLENNVGVYGQAVRINADTTGNWTYSHFIMYGGIIRNNIANDSGAGVKTTGTDSAFTMYGGVIVNNTSLLTPYGFDTTGGGVDTWRRTWIYGGKIINNKATKLSKQGYYGFSCGSAGYISADAIISDNYVIVSNIILNGLSTVNVGSTITLTATVSPSNVADKKLVWYSSNPDIAIVNQDGKVTGISSGTAMITAMANDGSGVKATKVITVKSSITGITITGDSKVSKGDIINLKATVTPTNASNKTLTWTSGNTNIATVNGTGLVGTVRGIEKGTVTITVATTDGSGIKTTKTITVEDTFVPTETNCILIGSSVDYQSVYSDSENDPIYKYNYLYNHNALYYDNNLGTIINNNVWLNDPIRTFELTGEYIIQHKIKDNPPTAMYNESFSNYRKDSNTVEKILYVHRKPIAIFTLNGKNVTDNSYDLDHQSSPTKGIVKWKWNYIHPDGNIFTHTTTIKTAGENKVKEWLTNYGANGKVYLRVQDVEGAWSDWSDDLPVADFVITYNPLILNRQSQKIIDQSFDSKELSLTYSWTVKKGTTTLFTSSAKDISSTLNTYINSNGTGNYIVSLRVTNSSGQQSNIRTLNFDVISINNQAPTANFILVSNESPAWSFPKVIGLQTLRYRPAAGFFHEERTRFNVAVTDPNSDNTGFNYNWKIERFAVKNIDNIYGAAANTYSYTTQYPFTNSFKSQGLPWGAYRITLTVKDKPPIPPYASGDVKTATVTKYYYIIPELSITGSYESAKSEIMVGDTVKLKAKTSRETENVNCTFANTNYVLSKVSEDSNFAYWEKNIFIPDSIGSGTYQLQFVANTTYGGNGSVTREIRDSIPIDIIALKLFNFRITDIVNHPHIEFPQTMEMLKTEIVPYKAGYFVTFKIDSKGKPDNVYGRIDVGNNGSTDQIINLTKVVSGDTETWQGRFYTSAYLSAGTVISIKLDCSKGTVTYDFNIKENWDGRSLITDGSALQDGRVNLTN